MVSFTLPGMTEFPDLNLLLPGDGRERFRAGSTVSSAPWHQVQSMVRHANINTTLVCSRNLDRVSQAGEFAVDRMLGES